MRSLLDLCQDDIFHSSASRAHWWLSRVLIWLALAIATTFWVNYSRRGEKWGCTCNIPILMPKRNTLSTFLILLMTFPTPRPQKTWVIDTQTRVTRWHSNIQLCLVPWEDKLTVHIWPCWDLSVAILLVLLGNFLFLDFLFLSTTNTPPPVLIDLHLYHVVHQRVFAGMFCALVLSYTKCMTFSLLAQCWYPGIYWYLCRHSLKTELVHCLNYLAGYWFLISLSL